MKKQNCLVSLILACVMCFGVSGIATASEANLSLFPDAEEINGLAEAIRTRISWDSTISYNKSEIEVGERLNLYSYERGTFVKGAAVYPVFSGGKLYDLFLGGTDKDRAYFSSLAGLAQPLNNIFDVTDEFALIFDRHHCYAYDGAEWYLLKTYGMALEPKDDLDIGVPIDTSVIELNSLEYRYSIGELKSMELAVNQPKAAYITLPLDFVAQDGDSICWAACVAAIVNFLTGTDYISLEIAQNYWYGLGNNTWNKGLVIGSIPGVLDKYNVTGYKVYQDKSDKTNYLPEDVNDMVYDNIAKNYPVYATFETKYSNHACVIYGVAPGGSSMLIMNPEPEYSYDNPDQNISERIVDKDSNGYYYLYGETKFYLAKLCAKIVA